MVKASATKKARTVVGSPSVEAIRDTTLTIRNQTAGAAPGGIVVRIKNLPPADQHRLIQLTDEHYSYSEEWWTLVRRAAGQRAA
jgi:hypothetical protein